MANDLITQLDDEQVQGLTLNEAVEKMRGPVNTKIRLTIVRKGADKPIDVTLVRDNIRVRSVRARVEQDDIGYIRVTTFNEQTTDGLKREINNIEPDRADKLQGLHHRPAQQSGRPARPGRRPSPTRSSTAARSSRPAAAMPRRRSAAPRMPATSPRASRSSC